MENKKICPYVFKAFTEEEKRIFYKHYTKDNTNEYIRVGPKGYVLPSGFLDHAAGIHDMALRPDDIFVVSYPRSGTTWTQELVWLLANDLDFERATSVPLVDRFPYLDMPGRKGSQLEHSIFFYRSSPALKFCMFFQKAKKAQEGNKFWEKYSKPPYKTSSMTSQRFFKTHLPLSLLPPALLDTSKVVYVARDMRDVAVSVYHFYKLWPWHGIVCDFKDFYKNMFSKNMLIYSPYFENLKEAWALKNHPNMLFIFYEELSKDLHSTARRVAKFLGKDYTDAQLESLCDYLAFDKFQNYKSVNTIMDDLVEIPGVDVDQTVNHFVRKGKPGAWRAHFNQEMIEHAEKWISEQLRGTGLKYPN